MEKEKLKIIDPSLEPELKDDLKLLDPRRAFMLGQMNMLMRIGDVIDISDIDPFDIQPEEGNGFGVHGNSCPHTHGGSCECACKECRPDLWKTKEEKGETDK